MKNRIIAHIILPLCFLLVGSPSALAQGRMRVFFNSGKVLSGVVKAQTEDVIVLTMGDGATYQYPMSDVRAVVVDSLRRVRLADKRVLKAYLLHETEDKLVFIDPSGAIVQCDKQAVSRQADAVDPGDSYQPVIIHLSFKGSVGSQPLPPVVGGAVEGDFAIGYRDVRRRHYFVGLGVGYDYRFNRTSADPGERIVKHQQQRRRRHQRYRHRNPKTRSGTDWGNRPFHRRIARGKGNAVRFRRDHA